MNKRHIMAIALVLVIITAGVLQYTYGKADFSAKGDDSEERLGEAVYVDNINGGETDNLQGEAVFPGDKTAADGLTNNYFAQARLERESIRSRQKEELEQLSSAGESGSDSVTAVQEEILKLVKRSEMEATIESLIKQRGFSDVVVILGTTGSVDLIVKADSLSPAQTAQLSDIVMRHAGVGMEAIHIRNMK
ncbi:MAG: SpoIIIAH-like family protein [Clostridiaceae bacterium]|nr:SpoIIIAH-like family protein [Clostridiaceae bacterium]